jgi:hypothetical protein
MGTAEARTALTDDASVNDETTGQRPSRDEPFPVQAEQSQTHKDLRQQDETTDFENGIPDKKRTEDNAPTVESHSNVIHIDSKARAKPTPDYSDWITVEKRRASQNVIAHYVRVKNDDGRKLVGFADYMSVADFKRRFSRKKTDYEKYKRTLVVLYKAQAVRAGERAFSDSSGAV